MTGPISRRGVGSRAASLAVVLIGLALPASAADFQIDGMKFSFGGLAISAPTIAVKGSTLERDAFLAVLNGSTGESAAVRMSKLTATEITAPELNFEQTIGAQKQVTTYRDIRFSDIGAGRIARGESTGGSVTSLGAPTGPMSGTLKRTRFEGFDLRHIARVLTEKAQPGMAEPMLPVFGLFETDGYALDLGAAGTMSLGRAVVRAFGAKVGDEPLGEVFTRLVALSDTLEKSAGAPGSKPAPRNAEEERRLALAMLSVYDAISYGSGEMRDFTAVISAPPKPGAKPETVEMKFGRIAFGEDAADKSGFSMEGLNFIGGDAKGRVASISYSGFSFGRIISELKAALSQPGVDLDALDIRRFIPTLGTMRVKGVTIDAPQAAPRGRPAPPPLTIALGSFEMTSATQLNGIPTSLSLGIDNLQVPVTEGPGNPAARDLIAMGYRMLDLSAKLDLAWDEPRSELAIRALSLGVANMARLDAKGTLGNVTKDLFASDLALAQVAALGATVRSVEAKLQNFGLFERLVDNEARKAKRKPEDMRREYSMMANLGLAAIFGPSDAAKTLTAAISRFVAKPGTLSVQASAKSGSGLGLADVITLTDPTEIFDKINLQANAE